MPVIIPGNKPEAPGGFPVKAYSYSSFSLFCTNPVLFRIKHVNGDRIETTKSSTSVLGDAVHFGLKAFLGGCDEYLVPNDDAEALKIALTATSDFIRKYPDGFVDWKKNVPDRGTLENLALLAIPRYVREWDRTRVKELLMVEEKLSEAIRVRVGNREISLPIPLVGYPDTVYEDLDGNVVIEDHKTVFRYSDPDAVDGAKLIQAGMYYLLVAARLGRAPERMVFREYKIPENSDKSPQTREYVIVFREMTIVFDLLFRLYEDITAALLGKAVFVPNILAMFDRDVALLAYIHRLDEPTIAEGEKKKHKVEDIADVLQKKLARSRNLKRFMEAKANLFTSHVSLNYDKMQAHEKIKFKMMEHGIPLEFADKVEGLSVDLYRFTPSVGVKMTTIEKYAKDAEQALGTSGVRILAPIPDTNFVGFEVPKKKRSFAPLPSAKASFEIPVGVNVYGETRTLDLREAPHLLVAGAAGSGKSVFLASLLKHLSGLPKSEVRFALFDPKMVELSAFEDDPHTESYRETPEDILSALSWYVHEMDARYTLFKKHKVKNLAQYREKVAKDKPYIVVVIDEFGDLLLSGGKVAEEIRRIMITLAQKARAAGIHLVAATQRPSSKVVDGLIKANFPTRVAFRTASRIDSEIIIDRHGAEVLLGKGDMLFLSQSTGVERLQGFLTE